MSLGFDAICRLLSEAGFSHKVGEEGLLADDISGLQSKYLRQTTESGGAPGWRTVCNSPFENDRFANIRSDVKNAATKASREKTIRSEIAGLLERMSPEQLTLARANLSQILDADQASSLNKPI